MEDNYGIEQCGGINCIWYDPWEGECTANYEDLDECRKSSGISVGEIID